MTTTQEYVLLLHGDEAGWRDADEAAIAEAYREHGEFSRLCAERGHEIVGGAELRLSETSLVVRRSGDAVQVTEGPFTETVEQLGGFYQVRTADVRDLAELAAMLVGTGAVEIRPVVPSSEQPDAALAGAEAAS
ncbi:YciI family protein [Actinotalea solisilvae]|uniref:YciI family protein n=1 Tax=Actinotalea solisilvae TaxID=2072922 RepID=UPI0018F1831D|nr:YciI family protein [Actinotalea solisilvae]